MSQGSTLLTLINHWMKLLNQFAESVWTDSRNWIKLQNTFCYCEILILYQYNNCVHDVNIEYITRGWTAEETEHWISFSLWYTSFNKDRQTGLCLRAQGSVRKDTCLHARPHMGTEQGSWDAITRARGSPKGPLYGPCLPRLSCVAFPPAVSMCWSVWSDAENSLLLTPGTTYTFSRFHRPYSFGYLLFLCCHCACISVVFFLSHFIVFMHFPCKRLDIFYLFK